MPKYWIITVSEENWSVIVKNNVYGAPETKGVKPAHKLIGLGDVLLFYVMKRGSKKLGERFVGAFKTISEWYRENKPLWPDERREGRVKYPWRVRLEPIKLGAVEFERLVPGLSFVKKKDRAYAYLVGTPALRRPIPKEDAQIIINALK